jgi:hypothetical protein
MTKKSDTDLNEGLATSSNYAILIVSDVFNLFAVLSFQLPTTFPPIHNDWSLLLPLKDV